MRRGGAGILPVELLVGGEVLGVSLPDRQGGAFGWLGFRVREAGNINSDGLVGTVGECQGTPTCISDITAVVEACVEARGS